jgi:hypothetical protein
LQQKLVSLTLATLTFETVPVAERYKCFSFK